MKKVLAVILMLGLASMAQAATATVEFVPVATHAVAGGTAQQFTMVVTAPEGFGAITAIDIQNLVGSFYQLGTYFPPILAQLTPVIDPAAALSSNPADTHWNFTAAQTVAVINAATENNNWQYGVVNPAIFRGEGNGTFLSATLGFLPSANYAAAVLNLANIVTLDANSLPAPGTVIGAVANVNGAFIDAVVVPEPASLSLLVLGGLGVLARRRRA